MTKNEGICGAEKCFEIMVKNNADQGPGFQTRLEMSPFIFPIPDLAAGWSLSPAEMEYAIRSCRKST